MFLKEVSYPHQSCIYLIENTVKMVILRNITNSKNKFKTLKKGEIVKYFKSQKDLRLNRIDPYVLNQTESEEHFSRIHRESSIHNTLVFHQKSVVVLYTADIVH